MYYRDHDQVEFNTEHDVGMPGTGGAKLNTELQPIL